MLTTYPSSLPHNDASSLAHHDGHEGEYERKKFMHLHESSPLQEMKSAGITTPKMNQQTLRASPSSTPKIQPKNSNPALLDPPTHHRLIQALNFPSFPHARHHHTSDPVNKRWISYTTPVRDDPTHLLANYLHVGGVNCCCEGAHHINRSKVRIRKEEDYWHHPHHSAMAGATHGRKGKGHKAGHSCFFFVVVVVVAAWLSSSGIQLRAGRKQMPRSWKVQGRECRKR